MRLSKKALVSAVALGTTMMTGSGYAQIEEIIITSELRETNVQATPLAVTAISGEMMEVRNQTNLVQISAQAPNVTLSPAGVGNGPAMLAFIRGVGQTDFNYALEPGVGIYVDDVYFPTLTGTLMELLDLNRVEILRGPQGTLAGRNAIGGFVKLYSQKPGAENGGRLSVTAGSYNRVDVNGAADMTIADGLLYARFSGVSKSQDGFVDRLDYGCVYPNSGVPTFIAGGDLSGCRLGTEGGRNVTAGRASFLWTPREDFEANLVYDITNEDSEAPPGVLLQVNEALNRTNGSGTGTFINHKSTGLPIYYSNAFVTHGAFRQPNSIDDPYATFSTYIDPNQPSATRPFSPGAVPAIQTLDQTGVSLTADWAINDNLALKSITSYREYDSDWGQDADASPINSQQLLQRLEHSQKGQELRLTGAAFDDRLDYTVGGFWFEQDGTLEANVNLHYAQLNFIHGPDPTPSETRAVFANTAFHVTDDLNLSVGLRYSEDEKDYVFRRRNPDGSLPVACITNPPASITNPPNCALNGLFDVGAHFEDDRTDWRVALDYAITDDIMAYGQVSTGYKAGGINPRPFFIIQIESVKPEEILAYEIGAKSVLFDNTLRLNAAFFLNDYTDIQLQQSQCEVPFPPFFGAPCLQPANAGDADVTGFEVEAELNLDRWIVDASISTLDFEYTRVDSNVAITKTMTTPFTPELKYSLGAQYTMEIGDMGSLSSRLDLSYQDDIYTNPTNAPTNLISDYTLVNGRITWKNNDDTWEASLEGNNLTDELYYSTIFDQYLSSGTVTGSVAMPRTWAVTLKRNF